MDEKVKDNDGSRNTNVLQESAESGDITSEELIWEGSPSWKVDFFKYTGYPLLALLLAAGAIIGGMKSDATLAGIIAGLIVIAVVALYLMWLTIVRRATRYTVTNLNIQVKQGVFTTSITNLETWRIRDSAYYQSFMEKIMGIGRVLLHTQDADTPTLELEGLPANENLYEKIKNAYVVARQRRNVLGLVE